MIRSEYITSRMESVHVGTIGECTRWLLLYSFHVSRIGVSLHVSIDHRCCVYGLLLLFDVHTNSRVILCVAPTSEIIHGWWVRVRIIVIIAHGIIV